MIKEAKSFPKIMELMSLPGEVVAKDGK